jgi:uncharacterized protein DUF4440
VIVLSMLALSAAGCTAARTDGTPPAGTPRSGELRTLSADERAQVLTAREAVWRAWFAGDTAKLGELVPPELITIEPASDSFGTRESVLASSRDFAASGGRLTRIVFPRTEFQAYGETVILYTTYELDLASGGQTRTERGRATEIFVHRGSAWLNTGWQLASRDQR